MAHGTPDYGVTAGAVTTHQLLDVGELAARLGSPNTYDRRGDVIWWDDFECGLAKWGATFVNGVGSSALSTVEARNGRTSLLTTTAAAAAAEVDNFHQLPYPVFSRLGLEASFMMPTAGRRVQLQITLRDGTNLTLWSVRWDSATGALAYLNAAGTFTTFATVSLEVTATKLFHTAKLVVDPTDGRYERLVLDNNTYDLSAFSPQLVASGQLPYMEVWLFNGTGDGVARSIYWDDVIVTQNEPANP